jgi:hypothetical protein
VPVLGTAEAVLQEEEGQFLEVGFAGLAPPQSSSHEAEVAGIDLLDEVQDILELELVRPAR